jgi:hypothetical protein
MAIAAVFAACAPANDEDETLRRVLDEGEIISDYRIDLLRCAEDRAQYLYYGEDEYFAVTLDDLEDCAY